MAGFDDMMVMNGYSDSIRDREGSTVEALQLRIDLLSTSSLMRIRLSESLFA